jgi:hypothetical protein
MKKASSPIREEAASFAKLLLLSLRNITFLQELAPSGE